MHLPRDVGANQPWDLEFDRDGHEWRVEVKGTTGDGESIILTAAEVENARSWPRVALFVVTEIQLEPREDGWIGLGGRARIIEPWRIDEGDLSPTVFRYRLPPP